MYALYMTQYTSHSVKLSTGQKSSLAKAYKNKEAITLRLAKGDLSGNDELMLTKAQINRLKKASSKGTGADIKVLKAQIRKVVKNGGNLFGSMLTLGSKLLPYAAKAATKVVPGLATGALSSLGSLGVDKIFGRGQTGGFMIPQNKIIQLIACKNCLTAKQKNDIVNALQSGGSLVVKPAKKNKVEE